MNRWPGNRRRRYLALAALLVLLVLGYCWRHDFIGWWYREASYQGRYTNYWRAEFQRWDVGFDGAVQNEWLLPRFVVAHRESSAEYFLRKSLPFWYGPDSSTLPLQAGDLAALPVLEELLQDDDPRVRLLSVLGIGRMGAAARTALPAIKRAAHDPDRDVRLGVFYVYVSLDRDDDLAHYLHESWRNDVDDNLRAAARLVLAQLQEPNHESP